MESLRKVGFAEGDRSPTPMGAGERLRAYHNLVPNFFDRNSGRMMNNPMNPNPELCLMIAPPPATMPPTSSPRKPSGSTRHLRQMAFDAIRKRFPEMDDSENKLAFIELTYGKSLPDAIRSQAAGASR